MKGLRYWLWVWVLCIAWLLPGTVQAMPEGPARYGAERPPASWIRDEGGFFRRDPAMLKRLSTQFGSLEKDYGFKIYLMIEPVLIGTSASELAAELRQVWLPDGDGLVLVFEADSGNLGIGRDLAVNPEIARPASVIPTYETEALIARAMGPLDPTLRPDDYLEALATNLVVESRSYFQRRESPPPGGRSLRVALVVVGATSVLALAALGIAWLLRHSPMREVPCFRFPAVDRPECLGAPCGARVTARRFSAGAGPKD